MTNPLVEQSPIELFFYIKKVISFITKVITIIICIYYITQMAAYEIRWCFLESVAPNFAQFMTGCVNAIGTLFLILPITLIIVSMFVESFTLNLVALFISFSGVILGVLQSFSDRTLGDVQNLGFCVIIHVATLNKKKELFLVEFDRLCVEISKVALEKAIYIKQHLTTVDFFGYDSRLKDLKSMDDIQKYAFQIVTDLGNKYDTLQIQAKTPFNLLSYVTPGTLFFSMLGITTIIIIICFFRGDNGTQKVAEALKDSAVGSHDTAKVVNDVAHNVSDIATNINANIVPQGITTSSLALQNATDIANLKQGQSKMAQLINQLFKDQDDIKKTLITNIET